MKSGYYTTDPSVASLLHRKGIPLRVIAFGIGIILGNPAASAGVKLAAKVLVDRHAF